MSLRDKYTDEEFEALGDNNQGKLVITAPDHYDNTHGSLYKIAEQRKLNSYEYDVLKHLIRCRNKGEWVSDIDKCIDILNMYKLEQGNLYSDELEIVNKKQK